MKIKMKKYILFVFSLMWAIGFSQILKKCSCPESKTTNCVCLPTDPCKPVQPTETKFQAIIERMNDGKCYDEDGYKYACTQMPENNEKTECGTLLPSTRRKRQSIRLAHSDRVPWVVGIVSEEMFISFGSLIHPRVVMTVTHSVYDADIKTLEVVSYIKKATEPNISKATLITCHSGQYKRRVIKKIEHTPYDKGQNFNDISLLILKEPFIMNTVTRTICLPKSSPSLHTYSLVQWSTIEGSKSLIIESYPLWKNEDCQKALRKTRLSRWFVLHDSFVCAGGEEGKDSGPSDGGSALYGEVNNKLTVTAMASWGLEGKKKNVPGVYVDVSKFTTWIQDTLKKENIDLPH